MTLAPLLSANLASQLHLLTVLPAIPIGIWMIYFSKKGSRQHKLFGRAYFSLLIITTLIAFSVRRIGAINVVFGLSPAHFVSLFTLFSVWMSWRAARKGNIKQHKLWATGLFFGALLVNGLLNIFQFPGVAHDVFFGP